MLSRLAMGVLLLAVSATVVLAGKPQVDSENLTIKFDPGAHTAQVNADLNLSEVAANNPGYLDIQLTKFATISSIKVDGNAADYSKVEDTKESDEDTTADIIRIPLTANATKVTIVYSARLEQDASQGEVEGQIHNFEMQAHIGEDGIFLSDSAAWHPVWVDPADDLPGLMNYRTTIEPLSGWTIVVSGNPVGDYASPSDPCWVWETPRPIDGLAIAGGKHTVESIVYTPPVGSDVEIVMQVSPANAWVIPAYFEEAKRTLEIYTPLLGEFPFKRMTIVENFFSSGFAYPGFTLLGGAVVSMGPRALRPGYLDHELTHNWWGNGVYVDPNKGNWCEAVTSYCTNYYRRIAEDGEEGGREYRRSILMKLATDPDSLDNGPVGDYGKPGGPDRFVGYEKGSFVLMMLEKVRNAGNVNVGREKVFAALRRVVKLHLGQRISWDEIQAQLEDRFETSLDDYFRQWVYKRILPETFMRSQSTPMKAFAKQYTKHSPMNFKSGHDSKGNWIEIDPNFQLYRLLPAEQIVPTINGTFGNGGLQLVTYENREEVEAYKPRLELSEDGENLMLIGRQAVEEYQDLIAQTGDPIKLLTAIAPGFSVAGEDYIEQEHSVLHSMPYPGRPGRFITVFLSNGDVGWSRLRLIGFYSRDSTVVWKEGEVVTRRVFEPDRRFRLD